MSMLLRSGYAVQQCVRGVSRMSASFYVTLGIRREDKNEWEARTCLPPQQVQALMAQVPDTRVIVQPCTKRIYPDASYESVGAVVQEDLTDCDVIVGVKEVPIVSLIDGKTYLFFSHTAKGQAQNMNMLSAIMSKKISLLDYELMTDDKGKRVIVFGYFAGCVGAVNALWGLGERLLKRGYRTPFLSISQCKHYVDLAEAKHAVQRLGAQLNESPICTSLGPLVITVTGDGNVATGAIDMLQQLPHKMVSLADLDFPEGFDPRLVYIYQARVEDYIVDGQGEPLSDKAAYMSDPSGYTSTFGEKILPKTSVLINGIYWRAGFPPLVTLRDVQRYGSKLVHLCDISCDINGSIAFMDKCTTIDAPFAYLDMQRGVLIDEGDDPMALQVLSVDNLPAEVPKDASDYFGAQLLPYLVALLQSKNEPVVEHPLMEVVERAYITIGGNLVPRFKEDLEARLAQVTQPPNALVLGSGLVSGPVIHYLAGKYPLTVADQQAHEHDAQVTWVRFDMASDGALLEQLVKSHDLVISLLPARWHATVAGVCLRYRRDLVTASYVSPEMAQLDDEAKANGCRFLNEIGLDPGLDHMSAMAIIDAVKKDNGNVISFKSWCGGLPAPEDSRNPLGYKFSWSPRGALLACTNPARYLDKNEMVSIPGEALLCSAVPVHEYKGFAFEAIPNRDSIHYASRYGLPQIESIFRGTLRYAGYAALMHAFRSIGLLSTEPPSDSLRHVANWCDALRVLLESDVHAFEDALISKHIDRPSDVLSALQYIGALSLYEPFQCTSTMLDSFCELLEKKLSYQVGERDLVFMKHVFDVVFSDRKETIECTLCLYGDPLNESVNGHGQHHFSAMAKTVGYPVALAAELLLTNRESIPPGVHIPTLPCIYEPILRKLPDLGIAFKHATTATASLIK